MIRPGIRHGLTVVAVLAGLAAAIPSSPAAPQDGKTTIRSDDHPGFGRVTINPGGEAAYHVDQIGDDVAIRFLTPVIFASPPAPPRNVLAIEVGDQAIELIIRSGSSIRPSRIGDDFVIDVLDPRHASAGKAPRNNNQAQTAKRATSHAPSPTAMAASPELGGRAAAAERPALPSPADVPAGPVPSPAGRIPVQAQPLTTPPGLPASPDPPLLQVTRQPAAGRDGLTETERPIGLLARRIKLPKGTDGSGFLVPFSDSTGAAAFREGDVTYVVFDERRPIDMASLRGDAVFGQASVQTLPNGTLLELPLPSSLSVALSQTPQGWRVAALTVPPRPQPIAAIQAAGRLTMPAEQAADVISMADPDTGATLLVGTQRRPGQAVAHVRRGVEFILCPTLQGVVIEPLSDAIVLKATPNGFSLGTVSGGLALSQPNSAMDGLMDAASLTRRLSLPTMRPDALMRHLTEQVSEAAMAPPIARGPKHRAAAESMISLGLDAEAESLLHVATEQDPREAASAETAALTAIAALLAGRTAESDGLNDPRLKGTDEIALWRAVRQAMQDPGSPNAAAVFATTAPLATLYPTAIRDRILPLIVETMIEGGEIAPAARLLDQRPNDPRLAYPRALRVQAEGDTDQALAMLDALASGRDQFDRARAAVRAVDLRLAAGKIDQAGAIEALEKLLYAWRGDERELALHERVAELRGQTGAWREALLILRQAETNFPEQAAAVHERLKDTFAAMLGDPDTAKMQPLDFVSMVDENADLITGPEDEEAIAQPLADRLLALDLPGRAKPLLQKLMRSAASDVAKARLGASLATLEARANDDAGALATLEASEGPDLPPDLIEQRALVRATAMARHGDPGGGAAILAGFKTGQAAAARAQIRENANDWVGAEQAWSECAALTVPDSGPLDEAGTRTILRLAAATARAGDEAGRAALHAKYADRIATGPLGDMVRLLAAEPIRSVTDIERSKLETSLAESLPASLKALQAATVAR